MPGRTLLVSVDDPGRPTAYGLATRQAISALDAVCDRLDVTGPWARCGADPGSRVDDGVGLDATTTYDTVVLNHIRSLRHGWQVPALRRLLRHSSRRPRVAYLAHNPESWTQAQLLRTPGYARRRAALTWAAHGAVEHGLGRRCDRVWALSDRDAELLTRLDRPVDVVAPVHCPSSLFDADDGTGAPRTRDLEVLLLSSFLWGPKRANATWFAREVLPALREAGVMVTLAGTGSDTLPLSDRRGVDLLGEVPGPELATTYDRARVLLVVDRQPGGVKYKLLQAASRGVPIVCTPAAAMGSPIDGLRIAHDGRGLAAHTLALLGDDRVWQSTSAAVRASFAQALGDADRNLQSWRGAHARLLAS